MVFNNILVGSPKKGGYLEKIYFQNSFIAIYGLKKYFILFFVIAGHHKIVLKNHSYV